MDLAGMSKYDVWVSHQEAEEKLCRDPRNECCFIAGTGQDMLLYLSYT